MLKAEKPEPFAGGLLKARLFLTQVELKMGDVDRPSESRKIRYAMSLLRGPALEWAANRMHADGGIGFASYQAFKD